MAEQAKWYVIHTYSGYENKVSEYIKKVVENRGIQDLIPEVMVPTELVTEVKDNKTTEAERKLFPSYVLVKMEMSDATWHVVRNITGVTGFVGPGSKPVPLSDREVEEMGIETKVVSLAYEVGDHVKILSTDFEGVVASISDDKKKVRVTVSMFGRQTPIDVDATDVEKITY